MWCSSPITYEWQEIINAQKSFVDQCLYNFHQSEKRCNNWGSKDAVDRNGNIKAGLSITFRIAFGPSSSNIIWRPMDSIEPGTVRITVSTRRSRTIICASIPPVSINSHPETDLLSQQQLPNALSMKAHALDTHRCPSNMLFECGRRYPTRPLRKGPSSRYRYRHTWTSARSAPEIDHTTTPEHAAAAVQRQRQCLGSFGRWFVHGCRIPVPVARVPIGRQQQRWSGWCWITERLDVSNLLKISLFSSRLDAENAPTSRHGISDEGSDCRPIFFH